MQPQVQPRGEISQLQELQIPSFTSWDRVGAVNSILAELEQGQFYNAAKFVTQMLRDDRVRGCTNTRIYSLLGMPWHMEPAKHSAGKRSTKLADEATEQWGDIAPEQELVQLLTWALYIGAAPAQIVTNRTESTWLPSFRAWHPAALWFDVARDQYQLQYSGGQLTLERDAPDWILCTPFGYKYGRLNGLLSALAMPYLCRQWAFRDRARHSEQWGQPIKQVIAPAGATPSEVNAARRAVSVAGSEIIIASKQGTDGNRWDFKLHEAQADGHEVFESQIRSIDESIAIVLQGQSMSTTGNPGLGAQAAPGDLVRRDIMRFDAKIVSWIAKRLLGLWAEANYGDASLAPTLVIDIDPPEDQERNSKTLFQVANAISVFQRSGVSIDVEQLAEAMDIPLLEGVPAVVPPAQPDPADPASPQPEADAAAPA